jgi:CheY-like chemotaxis protein
MRVCKGEEDVTPPRILVVEDECVLAENLKRYLGKRSPHVCSVANGEQAIEVAASFAPDVVVMDFGLPKMNGAQAYGEIVRRQSRRIGCVMISGYPLENIAPAAHARGIRHLLCKPFSLAQLQQMVDRSAQEAAEDAP